MLNIPDELKSLYKQESIPKRTEIYFPELDLTTTNDQIVNGSFSLSEQLCSNEDLTIGSCEASEIRFTVADISQELKEKIFTVKQIIGEHEVPMGTYKVGSAKKQNNRRFKDVIAYDMMLKFDVDVSDWYNSLSFPLTKKQFRKSLCQHVGITEEERDLPNDDMMVEKTIEPTKLSGRTVLKACEEISGCFGHMNREGKLRHVILSEGDGLYPSETLYPSDNLYPQVGIEFVNKAQFRNVRFEEYTAKGIDLLQIRQEEGDVGATVGYGTNTYVIQGNFLVFGKSAEELTQIANNIFDVIKDTPYRPFESQGIGLPYLEVGDPIGFELNDFAVSLILKRTLTGIQALTDTYSAEGSEEMPQKFGLADEIMQLKGRSAVIKRSVDELSQTVTNLEEETESKFEQTANQIVLKVDASGRVVAVQLGADADEGSFIDIKADNIKLEGLVTANGYFKIKNDGSIEAVNGKFSGAISGGSININERFIVSSGGYLTARGANFTDGIITSNGSIGKLEIDGASISGFNSSGGLVLWITANGNINAAAINVQNVYCGKINDANPITSSNIGAQSVAYANVAGTASNVSNLYTNQIYASNTGYGNIDFMGFDNAAGVNWAQANFAPIGSSDIRLKHSILPLDDIPDELFFELKPYQFKYKTDTYGDGIFFGLIAQQVESAFERYGLNPYDYDLIDVKDVRAYTDDGQYVSDKTHRIHYTNLISWLIKIVQKQNERIKYLENIII